MKSSNIDTFSNNEFKSQRFLVLSATAVVLLVQLLVFFPKLKPFFSSDDNPRIVLPYQVYGEILLNIFIQCSLWLTIAYLICWLNKTLSLFFKLSAQQSLRLCIAFWAITMLAIFSLNQYYFPRSQFSTLTGSLFPQQFIGWFALVLCLFLSFAFALSLCIAIKKYWRGWLLMCSSLLVVITFYASMHRLKPIIKSDKPNVIIIGIDGLRPDMLHSNRQEIMPNLIHFLTGSVRFNDATTPLGRTYGAWVSILTGHYPLNHGARLDLTPKRHTALEKSMGFNLQKKGYFSLYATDEKRFSNIDKDFGFNQIIGPKIGANDFILGTFNDFPLSNLISQTLLGKFLFPYNYLNRADFISYYPSSFTKALNQAISRISHRPLFLAIHLTLPHWPYIWANSKLTHPPRNKKELLDAYKQSLSATDKQFKSIITTIKGNHLLDKAIVVLVSDHGESLGIEGDRLTTKRNYYHGTSPAFAHWIKKTISKKLSQSIGHGSDVLSPSQNQVLLAFHFFGLKVAFDKQPHFPVSLIDIKPSLAHVLEIYETHPSDGVNLFTPNPTHRPLYLETGFNPDDILSYPPSFKKILTLARTHYSINPQDGYVTLNAIKRQNIINQKQLSVYDKNYIIALYPMESKYLVVIVNRNTHKWSDSLDSPLAKSREVQYLLNAACSFYKLRCTREQNYISSIFKPSPILKNNE